MHPPTMWASAAVGVGGRGGYQARCSPAALPAAAAGKSSSGPAHQKASEDAAAAAQPAPVADARVQDAVLPIDEKLHGGHVDGKVEGVAGQPHVGHPAGWGGARQEGRFACRIREARRRGHRGGSRWRRWGAKAARAWRDRPGPACRLPGTPAAVLHKCGCSSRPPCIRQGPALLHAKLCQRGQHGVQGHGAKRHLHARSAAAQGYQRAGCRGCPNACQANSRLSLRLNRGRERAGQLAHLHLLPHVCRQWDLARLEQLAACTHRRQQPRQRVWAKPLAHSWPRPHSLPSNPPAVATHQRRNTRSRTRGPPHQSIAPCTGPSSGTRSAHTRGGWVGSG